MSYEFPLTLPEGRVEWVVIPKSEFRTPNSFLRSQPALLRHHPVDGGRGHPVGVPGPFGEAGVVERLVDDDHRGGSPVHAAEVGTQSGDRTADLGERRHTSAAKPSLCGRDRRRIDGGRDLVQARRGEDREERTARWCFLHPPQRQRISRQQVVFRPGIERAVHPGFQALDECGGAGCRREVRFQNFVSRHAAVHDLFMAVLGTDRLYRAQGEHEHGRRAERTP